MALLAIFARRDTLRFGITPLTLRFTDLWDAVAVLREVLTTGGWQDGRFGARNRVT